MYQLILRIFQSLERSMIHAYSEVNYISICAIWWKRITNILYNFIFDMSNLLRRKLLQLTKNRYTIFGWDIFNSHCAQSGSYEFHEADLRRGVSSGSPTVFYRLLNLESDLRALGIKRTFLGATSARVLSCCQDLSKDGKFNFPFY